LNRSLSRSFVASLQSQLHKASQMASAACCAAQHQQAGWAARRAGSAGASSRPSPLNRQPFRRSSRPPPTQAKLQSLFQDLFRPQPVKLEIAPGIIERPLYQPSQMKQMGPFKVSPMGFGTWSWVSTSLCDAGKSSSNCFFS
jgi:hypothetical protein